MRDAPRSQLALPFALVGLLGGAVVGSIPGDLRALTWFTVVTPLVAGAWGAILTHLRRQSTGASLAVVVFGTLLAGAINAFILVFSLSPLALFHEPLLMIVAPAIVGVVFAVPFIPALAHVAHLDAQIGRARTGSIVDRAARRGPWAAALAWGGSVVVVAALAHRKFEPRHAFFLAGLCAFVCAIVLLLADLRSLFALRSPTPDVDLGVGEDVVVPGDARSYRVPPKDVVLVRGDPTLAARFVRSALRRDVIACSVLAAATLLVACVHVARVA